MRERLQSPGTTLPKMDVQRGKDPFTSPPISQVGDLKDYRPYRRTGATSITTTCAEETDHVMSHAAPLTAMQTRKPVYLEYCGDTVDSYTFQAGSEEVIDIIEKELKKQGFKREEEPSHPR